MGEKFEKTDPTTRRLAGADLQKALKNHNVRGDSPVARDLYARAEVVRGYCGELLVRIPDNTRRLLTADAYLTQLEHPEDSVPARSTGPYRIRRASV